MKVFTLMKKKKKFIVLSSMICFFVSAQNNIDNMLTIETQKINNEHEYIVIQNNHQLPQNWRALHQKFQHKADIANENWLQTARIRLPQRDYSYHTGNSEALMFSIAHFADANNNINHLNLNYGPLPQKIIEVKPALDNMWQSSLDLIFFNAQLLYIADRQGINMYNTMRFISYKAKHNNISEQELFDVLYLLGQTPLNQRPPLNTIFSLARAHENTTRFSMTLLRDPEFGAQLHKDLYSY